MNPQSCSININFFCHRRQTKRWKSLILVSKTEQEFTINSDVMMKMTMTMTTTHHLLLRYLLSRHTLCVAQIMNADNITPTFLFAWRGAKNGSHFYLEGERSSYHERWKNLFHNNVRSRNTNSEHKPMCKLSFSRKFDYIS